MTPWKPWSELVAPFAIVQVTRKGLTASLGRGMAVKLFGRHHGSSQSACVFHPVALLEEKQDGTMTEASQNLVEERKICFEIWKGTKGTKNSVKFEQGSKLPSDVFSFFFN